MSLWSTEEEKNLGVWAQSPLESKARGRPCELESWLAGNGRKLEGGTGGVRDRGKATMGVLLRSPLWAVWAQLQWGLSEEPKKPFQNGLQEELVGEASIHQLPCPWVRATSGGVNSRSLAARSETHLRREPVFPSERRSSWPQPWLASEVRPRGCDGHIWYVVLCTASILRPPNSHVLQNFITSN